MLFRSLRLEGNTGVAAYGVIANLSLVVLAIYTGIAQGIQPLISSGHGAGNIRKMQAVLKYALWTTLIMSAGIYAVVFLGADGIAGVFNSEGNIQLQAMAVKGLKLYFTGCPFAGFNIIISMYFASSGRALPAHIISLMRGFIIIIPAAYLLSGAAGLTGIWCAFPAAEASAAVLGGIFYIAVRRRKAGGF